MWTTLAALEEQILDAPASRMAGQGKETVGEVLSQDRCQQRLVKQMIEVRNVPSSCQKKAGEAGASRGNGDAGNRSRFGRGGRCPRVLGAADGGAVGGCPKDCRRTRSVFW